MARKGKEKDETVLEQSFTEAVTGKRIVSIEGLGRVEFHMPTIEDTRMADAEHSIGFVKALQSGLPTEKEMMKIAESRGVFTKKDEEELEKLRSKLDQLNNQLLQQSDVDVKDRISKELLDIRTRLLELQQIRQGFYVHTAESKADDYRIHYLVWACTYKPGTEERMWATLDEYNKQYNKTYITQLIFQFLSFLNGIPEEILSSAPEENNDSGAGAENPESVS